MLPRQPLPNTPGIVVGGGMKKKFQHRALSVATGLFLVKITPPNEAGAK